VSDDEPDGLWRRDPEAFLRSRYSRLIDNAGVSPRAAAQAIWMMARLANLPSPQRIVEEAMAEWEARRAEAIASAG
jgi:hypothetical protein